MYLIYVIAFTKVATFQLFFLTVIFCAVTLRMSHAAQVRFKVEILIFIRISGLRSNELQSKEALNNCGVSYV